jgi:transcriptional pleiotropic regulator of transition state genes
MKTKRTGITRPVDELGWIVIPSELRKTGGISTGDRLEFLISENGDIVISKIKKTCIFCGNEYDIADILGQAVCRDCFLDIAVGKT